jgi:hypothetical protein
MRYRLLAASAAQRVYGCELGLGGSMQRAPGSKTNTARTFALRPSARVVKQPSFASSMPLGGLCD